METNELADENTMEKIGITRTNPLTDENTMEKIGITRTNPLTDENTMEKINKIKILLIIWIILLSIPLMN